MVEQQSLSDYKLGVVEETTKCHSEALDKVGRVISGMDNILRTQDLTLKDHEVRLRTVEFAPAKKWDALVVGLLGAAATGLVGYFIGTAM